MSHRALIIDLDNTLIECGKYYNECTAEATTYLASVTGLDPKTVHTLLDTVDLAATTLPNAFNKERMPTAFAAVALAACHIAAPFKPELVPYSRHMLELERIGYSVFDAPYDEYPGVRETLAAYREAGWKLVLYTKGDSDVQRAKIGKHGYFDLFDWCIIVPKKDVPTLRKIVEDLDIDPATSVAIGDSLRDDIAPAQHLGFRTVAVDDAVRSWAYDDAVVTADFGIACFADLSNVIPLAPGPRAEATAA